MGKKEYKKDKVTLEAGHKSLFKVYNKFEICVFIASGKFFEIPEDKKWLFRKGETSISRDAQDTRIQKTRTKNIIHKWEKSVGITAAHQRSILKIEKRNFLESGCLIDPVSYHKTFL